MKYWLQKTLNILLFTCSMLALSAAYATDMSDVIRMCEAALKQPENEMMFKFCNNILKSIEENKTKNQFTCQCQWNTKMNVVSNGKLCEYNCNCECTKNRRSFTFHPITALSQQGDPQSDHGYICQGQSLYGYGDTPVWKRQLIGESFNVKTELTTISSHLVKAIDQVISCQ
jgi:hypothetical protein